MRRSAEDDLDVSFGFSRLQHSNGMRIAYMFNFKAGTIVDEENEQEFSCLDMYFVQEDGETFKASHLYHPYFLIYIKGANNYQAVEQYLLQKFESTLWKVAAVQREDLELV